MIILTIYSVIAKGFSNVVFLNLSTPSLRGRHKVTTVAISTN